MEFAQLAIAGAYLIGLSTHVDERGFFARTFCVDEFADHGLPTAFPQQSLARSTRAGTLRGLHLQLEPHGEDKYVRCVRGHIFDAFVDLRPASPTFLRAQTVELDAEGGAALFVPRGCAHGYQTLTGETDVLYAMSSRYAASAARSVCWNDPRAGIRWPIAAPTLSAADRDAPGIETVLAEIAARA